MCLNCVYLAEIFDMDGTDHWKVHLHCKYLSFYRWQMLECKQVSNLNHCGQYTIQRVNRSLE